MKKIISLSILLLSVSSFAELNSRTIDQLEVVVKLKLNETREMEGTGFCEMKDSNILKCTWYIKDTGNTPDTMNGIFEVSDDNTYKLIQAYDEYGC